MLSSERDEKRQSRFKKAQRRKIKQSNETASLGVGLLLRGEVQKEFSPVQKLMPTRNQTRNRIFVMESRKTDF